MARPHQQGLADFKSILPEMPRLGFFKPSGGQQAHLPVPPNHFAFRSLNLPTRVQIAQTDNCFPSRDLNNENAGFLLDEHAEQIFAATDNIADEVIE